jgi:hypothetical protein
MIDEWRRVRIRALHQLVFKTRSPHPRVYDLPVGDVCDPGVQR